ncbi:origin recognition complex subunit 5, putative [Plasmodium gallinaceum]|uniref:Origin recognition complex subunit 5, putative n=1 Tax=Plasmodium gallinaceum TaxID=5849 RepID=A0A1J1GSS6_PLAGA|nr:origin recognition complex subunit 5, putative [Plasmodium gallinaceum]CRG94360.1 origin recognition complex subunit 5, putative [Plasmodium gallinaceum]
MHKLKNNESDINSDDCNETAEECIYSFSPSKKKKNEEYYAKVSYETKFLNNLNDNNIKKENKKIYAADSEYKYSSHLNIIGLRKNENDDDKEENDSDEKGNHSDEKENDSDEKENDSDEKENDSDDKEENDSDDKEENDSDDKEENDSDEKENGDDYKISNDYDIDDYEDESCSDSMDKDSHLYDEELNEIIDKEYFKELIPAIPHDILNSYISCLKTCGFERQVQLHRLINLLGDLRDPISVIQILGLPGMGKTKVVKNFIKLMNVPFAYVNCLMAVYQSGRSARNVIYHTILKDLSINLLKEFNEYKKMNNVINYSYDPTKLVPNHVSSTDSFFSILHMLLSFKPENENNRNIKKNENTYNKKNSPINKNNNEIKNIKMTTNQNYYKDKLYDRSVVFILDNIRYLVRTHPDLFYALTRIHEYIKGPYNDLTKVNKTTRGLCVILINRSPLPDEIFDGLPQPPTVWFDSYTADMCKNILYRLYDTMCFESLLTINDKDLKIYYSKEKKKEFLIKRKEVILENDVIYDIWCRYVDYIINVSYKDYKSDFHELLFICSHMWPLFIRPILDGTLEPIVENMNALQRNIDTHIRVATYNHASHFTFELIDSVFLNENNLKNKIDLSFYSKILLVGAYLASRNLPITDKRFFNATVKGGAFSLPKKRKTKSKNESILTLIGQSIPKNFTFIRWLCLTDCLLVCFFDEQLILNSLICQQINTLIQLGFITFSSPNNLSCLVRNSLMNGVQWSGYCGSTLLNTTNNFSSIANNIFSESNNSMNYESLDPYTKLVIQVPEETIRNIAKEMKIPLDELII